MAKLNPSIVPHDPPATYWTIDPMGLAIRPVKVAKESDCYIWLKPDREHDKTGRPYPLIQRRKSAFQTFHTWGDAQDELCEELNRQIIAAHKTASEIRERLAVAEKLQPPAPEHGADAITKADAVKYREFGAEVRVADLRVALHAIKRRKGGANA